MPCLKAKGHPDNKVKYYPAFIDLKDRKAVVVGGGRVAERKVRSLVKAGALVSVISPDITAGLERLKEKGKIRHVRRMYRKGDAGDALVVIAATSSPQINKKVAQDARHLINVIDMPSEGNFIVPSYVEQDSLAIAVSTSGTSPAVSRAIRKEIERLYGREFGRYVRFLERVRQRAMEAIPDDSTRRNFLRSLASEEIFSTLRKEGFTAVSEKILADLNALTLM
ncbi:MAG: bifunctional precorrin-2 dehydrogenase/sirohydrochlorin ferrochelatase [Deferribacteres bacterium]|nr:bifunctional precorrin-2 dehydrogenase/sirohydrochlorin ferrochelatase [Deferribacteres bacterium]